MINYIRGYYVLTVEGIGTERFLNYLIRNNVKVYNIKRINSTKIEISINRSEMKEFKKAYRGSNFQITIKQKTGIPFIFIRIYKKKILWIGAVVSLLLLMLTSQFVTDIYISVPEGIKKEEIRKELYNVGLKPGTYKKNIDRKEIRDHIMLKFDEVAYMSINVKGTNIFVTITKKAESLDSKENSNYCNIISKKDGIIEKVIPRSGNSLVQSGDVVRKGSTLISGANTRSIPEVWATTFYEVTKSKSYEDTIKEKTNKSKNVYTIMFYDKTYTIRRNIDFKDYVIENKSHKISIGDYTFPIKVNKSTFYETINKKVELDKDQLKKDLQEEALKELDYLIPLSARYKNVSHDYKVNKNMLEYTVTVETLENIAKVYPLTKAEAEKMLLEEKENKKENEVIPSNPEKRPINDIRNQFENNDEKTNTEQ